MKYGTLTNLIYADSQLTLPKVGDGATLILWSDRRAYTVTSVERKCIFVTRDLAERLELNFEKGLQEYSYKPDPEAVPEKATLRKDGNYYLGGHLLKIGFRDEFYDYSF
ncbi:MAG: hypothetical protein LH606_22905 [Cytophagaceae bacterium]|nr:hypothetical protein [Cytophagaceae bacterium]